MLTQDILYLYSKSQNAGTTGVLVVDSIGLPIEAQGSLDKNHSGIMSSIMKNAARLQTLLSASPDDQIDTA